MGDLRKEILKLKGQCAFFIDGGEKFQIESISFPLNPGFLLFRPDGTHEFLTEYKSDNKTFVPFKNDDPLFARIPSFTAIGSYDSEASLLMEIRSFIKKWVDLNERDEKLLAFYVLFTYIYDAFMEVPYLHILADLGSGKTRLGVKVLGSICFRSFSTIGVSSIPALFRLMSTVCGTLILDEADIKKSEKTDEITQMLNSGYIKDLPVIRCEPTGKDKKFNLVSFQVFGPKILLSRESMKDDALESRCLPIHLKQTKRKDIPFLLSASLEQEAQEIRNKLLTFRMRNRFIAREAVDYSLVDLPVSARTKQLLLCISSVVRDKESKQMLHDYAMEVSIANVERRGESFAGELLEAIRKVAENPIKKEYRLPLKDIIDVMNQERDKKIYPQGIGKKIRETFGLRTVKSHGVTVLAATLQELNDCFEKFGIEPIIIPAGAELFLD